MSEYKGIARWSEDAVGMINWDDTTKEGTAQVTDEKTGEVYQIGGGGGSNLSIAEITIKASNDSSSGITTPTLNSEDGVKYSTFSATQSDYVIQVPLYNGLCTAEFWGDLEVTGGIVKDDSYLKITGDGTITFNGE